MPGEGGGVQIPALMQRFVVDDSGARRISTEGLRQASAEVNKLNVNARKAMAEVGRAARQQEKDAALQARWQKQSADKARKAWLDVFKVLDKAAKQNAKEQSAAAAKKAAAEKKAASESQKAWAKSQADMRREISKTSRAQTASSTKMNLLSRGTAMAFNKVGKGLMTFITLPLAGLGLAASKSLATAAAAGDKAAIRLQNQYAGLKAEFTKVSIVVLHQMIPHFQKLIDRAHRLTQWFLQLSPATQKMVTRIALFAAALGPTFLVIGKVIRALSGMKVIAGLVGKAFGSLKNIVVMASQLMNKAAWASLGPWGALLKIIMVVIGIATLGFGVLIAKNQKLRDSFMGIVNAVKHAVLPWLRMIVQHIRAILVPVFQRAVEAIKKKIDEWKHWMEDHKKQIAHWIHAAVLAFGIMVEILTKAVWPAFKASIGNAIHLVVDLIKIIWHLITVIDHAGRAIADAMTGQWDKAADEAKKALGDIGAIAGAVGDAVGGTIKRTADEIGEVTKGAEEVARKFKEGKEAMARGDDLPGADTGEKKKEVPGLVEGEGEEQKKLDAEQEAQDKQFEKEMAAAQAQEDRDAAARDKQNAAAQEAANVANAAAASQTGDAVATAMTQGGGVFGEATDRFAASVDDFKEATDALLKSALGTASSGTVTIGPGGIVIRKSNRSLLDLQHEIDNVVERA